MSELVGGKYTLAQPIGSAGRTEAYIAADTVGTRVVVSTAHVGSQADADRYAGRAQIASTLHHRDIAGVLDWGTDGNRFYTAQEWLVGKDLATALRERGRPFSGAVVAQMGTQVATALAAAHARNLVHGDLRLADIVQINGDDVKVAGLGLPASADPVALGPDAPPASAYYLSPEQARGESATAASDIYALGAVLYHLATGRAPFSADTGLAVASMHASSPLEPARRVNPEVPAGLESVISRAMAKNPEQRYESASEFAGALSRISLAATMQMPTIADTEVPVVPVPTKRSFVGLWAFLLAAAVVIVFGLWFFIGRGSIAVPDLTGMSLLEAQLVIADAELVLGDVTYREDYPAGIEDGQVFDQDPDFDSKVRKGALISLVVAGSELVDVPNVEGLGESEAVTALRDAGFELGTVEREFNADIDAGLVIKQVPGAGTQAPLGAPITLTVSKGKQIASVPSLVGMTQEDATTALEEVGLAVVVEQASSDSVAEGDVISQSLAAGVSVEANTQVTIVVSTGPGAPTQIRVPGVTGLSEADAVAEIEAAGLTAQVNQVSDPANAGNVVAQDPAMGTMVDPDSTVSINVAQ